MDLKEFALSILDCMHQLGPGKSVSFERDNDDERIREVWTMTCDMLDPDIIQVRARRVACELVDDDDDNIEEE